MANAEQGSQGRGEARKSATERVIEWRKNNPGKYNAYMRQYSKSEIFKEGRKRRYHDNIEEARKQSRERVSRFRERQKQQQAIDIFSPKEQNSDK